MAIKKNLFKQYANERKTSELNQALEDKKSYSQNRVFDEPDCINKNVTVNDEHNKHIHRLEKTVDKVPPQPKTNGRQTEDKVKTNGRQTVDKVPPQPKTNGRQTVDKPTLFQVNNLSKLQGVQRHLLIVLYQSCKLTGTRITQAIGIDYLSSNLSCQKKSIKSSILRLKKKNCITLAEYKDGRGGWSKYEIEEVLFKEIEQQDNVGLLLTTNNKTVDNSLHSSSSYKRTTTKDNKQSLPDEWQDIDFEDLKTIGFTVTQLKQLLDKNEPELVQESIYHFAFGMENNPQTQRYVNEKKALNVLMGVLRKGHGWTDPGYISPKERAMQEQLERRKIELARIKKMEEELFSLEFETWCSKQDKNALNDLVPPTAQKHTSLRQSALRLHFRENCWEKEG